MTHPRNAMSDAPVGGPDPAETEDGTLEYECYCGLGPACPIFRQMTPAQRTACTRDKRRTAQVYFKNGVAW